MDVDFFAARLGLMPAHAEMLLNRLSDALGRVLLAEEVFDVTRYLNGEADQLSDELKAAVKTTFGPPQPPKP